MQRRRLLTLGLASAAALALAGGAAGWLLPPGLNQDNRLSATGRGVLAAVGRAVLDQSLPMEEGARLQALAGLLQRIDAGAGAGITAELLSRAGLAVAMVEEGPLKSSSDFNQLESEAYPALYQESAARKTGDKAIDILQGRCVGGSTTVNWTRSFRTPASTLAFWQDRFGLDGYTEAALAPYFAQAERRLNIAPWPVAPNENNALLRRGARQLGLHAGAIARNVKGCWNLGSCGLGCRNIKPNGAFAHVPSAQAAIKIVAKHYVLSGGAINPPAVLLRSGAPDPHGRLGGRTFLHPVVMSSGIFDQKVQAWSGAPQSVYTDHFLQTQPIDGPMGYKLEAPPLHPLPLKPQLLKIVSAHVMGGCGLAGSERQGVTRPDGLHWQLRNLSIHDGSIFPTSLGANPQLSVYGRVNRLAQGLAQQLTGRAVALA